MLSSSEERRFPASAMIMCQKLSEMTPFHT